MAEPGVKYIKITLAKFNEITPDNTTFYRVIKPDGSEELYIGKYRLDNDESGGGGGNANIEVDTVVNWYARTSYVPKKGTMIVYSDYKVIETQNIPGLKVGDGITRVNSLPFVTDWIADNLFYPEDRYRLDDAVKKSNIKVVDGVLRGLN